MTKICPNCGGEIPPVANFCRYCGHKSGAPSPSRSPSSSAQERSSLFTKPVRAPEDTSSLEAEIRSGSEAIGTPEELRNELEEYIPILYARKRSNQVERDLRTTMDDLEAISTKLDLGLIDAEDAQKQIAETKDKIAMLKEERTNFPDGKLPIEEFLPAVAENQEKLQKIHEMKKTGRIERDQVYERLVAEYDSKIREFESKIITEKRKINVWINMLEQELESSEDEIASLDVRRELGEVDAEEFKSRKVLVEKGFEMKKVAIEVLRHLAR
ncbi:MAG: zinc-ribbon domain-containing protein [Candidatus Hodarchaeota archaeon]